MFDTATKTLSTCCLSSLAILWWIVHLRRWISTESTRTTWHLQAWPSSSASGMSLSPTPFTAHSVSHVNPHKHKHAVFWSCDILQKTKNRHVRLSSSLLDFEKFWFRTKCLCGSFLSVNTEACLLHLLPADMREPVFEFIRPPVYHPPQLKYPHGQPLRYLDRYRDGKEHTYGIYWL